MNRNRIPILAVTLSLTWLFSASPADAAGRSQGVSASSTDVSAISPVVSTISTDVSEKLSNTVKARLIGKLGADALWITVSVTGDTATLTGDVTNLPGAALAEQLALSVEGIRKVDNQVTVGANGKSCPTRHPKLSHETPEGRQSL